MGHASPSACREPRPPVDIGLVNIAPVDLGQVQPLLERLTYPRFRKWFDGTERVPDTVAAWQARVGVLPVGLAIANRKPSDRLRILSILVAPAFRRAGIGSALLCQMEALARRHGLRSLEAHHGGGDVRAAFLALLDRQGWDPPQHLEHRLAGPADWPDRKGPKWAAFIARIRRAGYDATPWGDLTAGDRSKALALEKREVDPAWPRFSAFEPHADPLLSVALRRHGDLVGWIHCESKPAEGYHHYVTGYVERALQGKGWLLAGLDSVCRRQAAAYGAGSVAVYETPGQNIRMVALMEKHLKPVSLWTDDRYISSKGLLPDPPI